MTQEKSAEDLHAPKYESYASKVFQESSVGVVASLSQTASLRRKAFKIFAFFLCLFGFLYQSGQFLAVVFTYPTTVDVEIVRPNILNIPGYTFCDNNGINRKIFCEQYPDRCQLPTASFCDRFEHYCEANETLVPKKEYYTLNYNMSVEEMTELNANKDDFILQQRPKRENITGPLLRKREIGAPSYICYSLYDRVNNSLSPLTTIKSTLFKRPVDKLSFHINPDEVFLPGIRAGVLFSVHSPFEAVNPFENGIFMKPGRTYIIFVSMEEELLLQKPYPTDCVNYTHNWLQRGRKGPRTQEMCLQECITGISMRCFNCVVPILIYPTEERFCHPGEIDESKCPNDTDEQFDACELKCKDDCRRTKYSYTVQERYNFNLIDENMDSEDEIFTRVDVEIYMEGDEIVVLKHSPKYMIVEVFSSIGGFIGCWLGISLLDITDIWEGFFRITWYSFKKKKTIT